MRFAARVNEVIGTGWRWEWSRHGALLLIALTLAMVGFSIVLTAAGRPALATIGAIFGGAFGSSLGWLETLTRATPLLLCGLAVAIPARVGLINIGGEGQLHMGAIAVTAVVLTVGDGPAWLMIALMIGAALIGGAFWAAIPGLLRARWSVNEVLVTLMLNYVAIFGLEYLVHGPWKDPSALGWPYSARFPDAAVLPTLGHSNVHLGLALAVVVAVVTYVLLRSTVWGFAIKIVNANSRVARLSGLEVAWYFVLLLMAGGAVAGLAGMGEVSVIQGRLRSGLSPGYGYTGFLIAWLAGQRVLLLVPLSVLVGGLYAGADAIQLTASLPSATVDIFMGLTFLAVLSSTAWSALEKNRRRGVWDV